MPYFKYNAKNVFYEKNGSGYPTIFLHGNTASSKMFTDVIPGLEIQIFEIKREEIADKITDLKVFEHAVMKLVERDIKRIRDLSF